MFGRQITGCGCIYLPCWAWGNAASWLKSLTNQRTGHAHAQRQHTAWKFPSKSLSNTWPRVSYLGFLFQWNNLRLFDKTSHDAQGLLTFKKHIEFSTSRTTSDQRDKHSEHELVPTSKRNLEPKLCYLMYGLTGRQHWNGYQFQTRNGIDKR